MKQINLKLLCFITLDITVLVFIRKTKYPVAYFFKVLNERTKILHPTYVLKYACCAFLLLIIIVIISHQCSFWEISRCSFFFLLYSSLMSFLLSFMYDRWIYLGRKYNNLLWFVKHSIAGGQEEIGKWSRLEAPKCFKLAKMS